MVAAQTSDIDRLAILQSDAAIKIDTRSMSIVIVRVRMMQEDRFLAVVAIFTARIV